MGHATMTIRDDATHRPPPLMMLLETRAFAEFGAFVSTYPLLRRAPRGDGHPVLVLPGLSASDASTWPLRAYLRDLGYAVHGWQLGTNRGPREGVEARLRERLGRQRMDHLSGTDASFLHLGDARDPDARGQPDAVRTARGLHGRLLRRRQGADRQAHAPVRHASTASWRRCRSSWPSRYGSRTTTSTSTTTCAVWCCVVPARWRSWSSWSRACIRRLLDRSRPLWEMYVIDGLEDGQVAYYTKAHHSRRGRQGGVEMAKVFYDTSPEGARGAATAACACRQRYQLGVAELLQAAVSNRPSSTSSSASWCRPRSRRWRGRQDRATRKKIEGERGLNLGMAPKTIFNVAITNQRSFSTLSLPLADIKALGKRVGGTVNTVVMAMCSSALRRFLLDRDLLPKKGLIAMVPVSLRSADDDLGNNQVSAIRVDLATEPGRPVARFKAIHASSEAAKAVVANSSRCSAWTCRSPARPG
jgi:hypothetical protein